MPNKLSPDLDDQQFQQNRTIPRQRFNHKETVTSTTGEWLYLPAGVGDVLVSVAPASGTARVEYTQDDVAAVEAGSAEGKPWSEGDVSGYTDSLMVNAVTAIRCVAAGGSTEFKVTA